MNFDDILISGDRFIILGTYNFSTWKRTMEITSINEMYFNECGTQISRWWWFTNNELSNVLSTAWYDLYETPSGFADLVCTSMERHCSGYFADENECRELYESMPLQDPACPIEKLFEGAGLFCYTKHIPMLLTRPDLHCAHISNQTDPNGLNKCREYECFQDIPTITDEANQFWIGNIALPTVDFENIDSCVDFTSSLSMFGTCSSIISLLGDCSFMNLDSVCCDSCRKLSTITTTKKKTYALEAFISLTSFIALGIIFSTFALIWHSFPFDKHKFVPEDIEHAATMNVNVQITRGDFQLSTDGFDAHSGDLNLIVGASGAGKSTFCSILAGNPLPGATYNGNISVNGESVISTNMTNLVQYIPQRDENFHNYYRNMNVSEVLRCHYLAYRPWSPLKCDFKKFFKGFTLNEHVLNQPLSSLSGGEELQVRILSSLMLGKPILICDEITSGLDSFTAVRLIKLLRRITDMNRITVILTLHQAGAEIFNIVDTVTVLSKESNTTTMISSSISEIYEFRKSLKREDRRLIPEGISLSKDLSSPNTRSPRLSTRATLWNKSLWTRPSMLSFSEDNEAADPSCLLITPMFVILFRIIRRQRRNYFRLFIFTLPCFFILGGSSLMNSMDPFNATWFLTSIVIHLCVGPLSTVVETSLLIRSEILRFTDDAKRGSQISWSSFIFALTFVLLIYHFFINLVYILAACTVMQAWDGKSYILYVFFATCVSMIISFVQVIVMFYSSDVGVTITTIVAIIAVFIFSSGAVYPLEALKFSWWRNITYSNAVWWICDCLLADMFISHGEEWRCQNREITFCPSASATLELYGFGNNCENSYIFVSSMLLVLFTTCIVMNWTYSSSPPDNANIAFREEIEMESMTEITAMDVTAKSVNSDLLE